MGSERLCTCAKLLIRSFFLCLLLVLNGINKATQILFFLPYAVRCLFQCCIPLHLTAAVSCGDPGTPTYSSRHGDIFSFDHSVFFRCLAGYELVGSAHLHCLSSASWSSLPPQCRPVQCSPLYPPPYGHLDSSNFTFGSVVNFSCLPGFMLDGLLNLSCGANKNWTSLPPTCIPVQCSRLEALPNSYVVDQNSSYLGKTVFACVTGYVQADISTARVCQADRSWNGSVLACKRKNLPQCGMCCLFEI